MLRERGAIRFLCSSLEMEIVGMNWGLVFAGILHGIGLKLVFANTRDFKANVYGLK